MSIARRGIIAIAALSFALGACSSTSNSETTADTPATPTTGTQESSTEETPTADATADPAAHLLTAANYTATGALGAVLNAQIPVETPDDIREYVQLAISTDPFNVIAIEVDNTNGSSPVDFSEVPVAIINEAGENTYYGVLPLLLEKSRPVGEAGSYTSVEGNALTDEQYESAIAQADALIEKYGSTMSVAPGEKKVLLFLGGELPGSIGSVEILGEDIYTFEGVN